MTRTPPRTLFDSAGRPIRLEDPFTSGGEGSIHDVIGDPSSVAKLYLKHPTPETVAKLEAMAGLKTAALLEVAAWPTSILRDSHGGAVRGFLMSRIVGSREFHELSSPEDRQKSLPDADWRYLAMAARNCAAAFETIHGLGHVVGDVNSKNILLSDQTIARLVDCDSFQIRSGGRTFPCNVGTPEFTPPELQGQSFRDVARTSDHDLFGLAVLIFQLLMMGRHPFAGVPLDPGELTQERAIREGRYAYSPDFATTRVKPPPNAPRIDLLSSRLVALFDQAFTRPPGSSVARRPSATDWRLALDGFRQELVSCSREPKRHAHRRDSRDCPWCHLATVVGIAYFLTATKAGPSGIPFDFDAFWAHCSRLMARRFETTLPPIPPVPPSLKPRPLQPDIKRKPSHPPLLALPPRPTPVAVSPPVSKLPPEPQLTPFPARPVLTLPERPMMPTVPMPADEPIPDPPLPGPPAYRPPSLPFIAPFVPPPPPPRLSAFVKPKFQFREDATLPSYSIVIGITILVATGFISGTSAPGIVKGAIFFLGLCCAVFLFSLRRFVRWHVGSEHREMVRSLREEHRVAEEGRLREHKVMVRERWELHLRLVAEADAAYASRKVAAEREHAEAMRRHAALVAEIHAEHRGQIEICRAERLRAREEQVLILELLHREEIREWERQAAEVRAAHATLDRRWREATRDAYRSHREETQRWDQEIRRLRPVRDEQTRLWEEQKNRRQEEDRKAEDAWKYRVSLMEAEYREAKARHEAEVAAWDREEQERKRALALAEDRLAGARRAAKANLDRASGRREGTWQRLNTLRDEYRKACRPLLDEIDRLEARGRDDQLRQYLGRQVISNARIKLAKDYQIANMARDGISTAADIDRLIAVGVASIGPVTKQRLIDWRDGLIRSFQFDLSIAIAPAERRAIESRNSAKLAPLRDRMQDAARDLEQAVEESMDAGSLAERELKALAIARHQAELDLRLMD